MIRGSALKRYAGDPARRRIDNEACEALDEYIPIPDREIDKPFLMAVEDVFSITGRGTVATGRMKEANLRWAMR